jgi:hypothetical protein
MIQRKPKFLIVTLLLVCFLIVTTTNGQNADVQKPVRTTDVSIKESWNLQTANSGWPERVYHSSVRLTGDKVLILGGYHGIDDFENDVWQSADGGETWRILEEHADWSARFGHGVVFTADGSLILMGGHAYGTGNQKFEFMNDVWKSSDGGETWARVIEHAGWAGRALQSQVLTPDGRIILMGGVYSQTFFNDVWISPDNGETWEQQAEHAGWTGRASASSVVMPDGTIILTGGHSNGIFKNDVWRSGDNGATWTLVNANAGWSARSGHTCVVLPDGSIVLNGGEASTGTQKDTWRSTDNGATWTLVNTGAGWSARSGHTSIVLTDGSIVLAGGMTKNDIQGHLLNDVWRLAPEEGIDRKQEGKILVTKKISPVSIKQGTDAKISITIFNPGPGPIHDLEILDTTIQEFPVADGILQYTVPLLEANGTRILTYTIRAIKPGSFRLNTTAVMYADEDGNYHLTYSDQEKVTVLAPLLSPTPQNRTDEVFRDFFSWIDGLWRNTRN